MAPTFQLVMKSGPTPGKVFDLARAEMVIGRDASADITINDAEVSRKHARLFAQGGTYMIEDLGSTNGTFVNGQRLMGPHVLKNGELIMFGENVGLVFEASAVDMDATIAAGPGQVPGLPPAAVKAPKPEPTWSQPSPAVTWEQPAVAEPAFVNQIPEGPVDMPMDAPVEKKSNTRTWILAGCGCLLILCCVVIGGAVAFDYFDLYCVSPFDQLFSIFGYCQ
jgi:hypothetical protein